MAASALSEWTWQDNDDAQPFACAIFFTREFVLTPLRCAREQHRAGQSEEANHVNGREQRKEVRRPKEIIKPLGACDAPWAQLSRLGSRARHTIIAGVNFNSSLHRIAPVHRPHGYCALAPWACLGMYVVHVEKPLPHPV